MKSFFYNPENDNIHPKSWCTGIFPRHSTELGDTSIHCPHAAICQKRRNYDWALYEHRGSLYDFPKVIFKKAEEFEACRLYLAAQEPVE